MEKLSKLLEKIVWNSLQVYISLSFDENALQNLNNISSIFAALELEYLSVTNKKPSIQTVDVDIILRYELQIPHLCTDGYTCSCDNELFSLRIAIISTFSQ